MDINDDATALVVNVPAGLLTGCKLELAYDNTIGAANKFVPLDRTPSRAAWPNACTLSEAVPAEGGTFSVALADIGMPPDAYFRLFMTDGYELLDYAWCNAANAWVDTGVKDTDVYGLELGLCPTDTTGTYAFCFGSLTGNGAGVSLQHSNNAAHVYNGAYFARWTDSKYTYSDHLVFDTTKMNTLVFGGNTLLFNGTKKNAAQGAKKWVTSPVGPSGHTISLNRIGDGTTAPARTKWYYVRFYDQFGDPLLDYVPVRKNNVVGFFDRARLTFVTPTGGGALTAGNVVATGAQASLAVGRLWTFSPIARKAANMTIDTTAGAMLTVQVKPGYGCGSKLYLAHGFTDGGDDLAGWSGRLEIASSVPAEGGTYTLDLVANDLATGQVFRVFAGNEYTPLTRVQQNSADDLIDTGIRDTTIWGCAYGHYCTGSTGNYSAFLGSGNGDKLENPGFRICLGGNKYKMCITQWAYNLYTYKYFDLTHDVCNDFKVTNNAMTYNGKSLLPEAGSGLWHLTPMGSSGRTFYMGNLAGATTCDNFGWWYYLSLEDRNGKKLLDYVPVQNASGTAGFFNRVTGSFVTPTSGGALVAGEVKAAATLMNTPLSGTLSADPQLPLTATWHGAAGGDLNAAANWACTNAFGVELADTLPRAGITAVTFAGPIAFAATTASANIWKCATFVDAVLSGDCDWSGLEMALVKGSLDLAGHSLTLTGLPPVGEITSSTEGDPGELHITVAEGNTVDNTGMALNGNLRFVKEGPGLFIATKSPQNYTGGNDVLAGTLKCGVSGSINIDHHSCFGVDPVMDVRAGGTLDYAGTYYWGYHTINLYGGTLLNSVKPSQYHFNPNLNLYEDSFFDVNAVCDFQTNSDNLNGHTLNVNMRDAYWMIVNSHFKNGTVVVTGTGCFNFELNGALDCSTASFDIASQLNMNCTKGLTVSNFVVRCAEGKVTGSYLAQPLCVKGRFTPVTQTFPKIELQNGATLDLSGKNDTWSVASTVANCSLSFAANATVTVDTGSRLLTTPRLVAWDEAHPPANVGTLTAVSNRPRIKLVVRDNGIYALGGIVIICR